MAERSDRVDAATKCSLEMVVIQRHRRLDGKPVLRVRDHPQPHRACQRNLFEKKLLGEPEAFI